MKAVLLGSIFPLCLQPTIQLSKGALPKVNSQAQTHFTVSTTAVPPEVIFKNAISGQAALLRGHKIEAGDYGL